jgi:hypothetical protein
MFQDFTTYTVVDGAVRFSAAANVLTIANLDNDEAYYAYKDFTAAYFAADFESFFRFRFTVGTGAESIYLAAYANGVGAISALVAASGDALWLAWDNGALSIAESNGGSITSSVVTTLALDTEYFVRLARDESVGTYGTLLVYVYADRQMTELVVASSLALSKKTDFRYLYAASGKSTGGGGTALSGTISYLDLTPNPFTRKRIREDLREIINSTSDTPTTDEGFVSNADLNQWIDDAVADICARALCDRDIDSDNTSNAQRYLSYTGIKMMHVVFGTLGIPQIREEQIGHEQTGEVTPSRWWDENSRVGIDPLPAGSNSLTLYVADQPAAMTSDFDIPLILPQFRQIIFFYCLVRWLLKTPFTLLAMQFHNMYLQELRDAMTFTFLDESIEALEETRIPTVSLFKE